MTVSGLTSNALLAVQRGQSQAADAAHGIAKAGTTDPAGQQMLESTVQLKQAELLAKAGAKALGTANEAMGSIIDVLA